MIKVDCQNKKQEIKNIAVCRRLEISRKSKKKKKYKETGRRDFKQCHNKETIDQDKYKTKIDIQIKKGKEKSEKK